MPPTIDLSFETPDYGAPCRGEATNKAEWAMKKVFPSLTIPNNIALAKSLTAGQEFTATVRLRVAEVMIRERADGGDSRKLSDYPGEGVRVELEVQSMTPQGVSVEDEEKAEDDGADAIKKYFGNNGKKRPQEE